LAGEVSLPRLNFNFQRAQCERQRRPHRLLYPWVSTLSWKTIRPVRGSNSDDHHTRNAPHPMSRVPRQENGAAAIKMRAIFARWFGWLLVGRNRKWRV